MLRFLSIQRRFVFRFLLLAFSIVLVKHNFFSSPAPTSMSLAPDASEVASSLLREKGLRLQSLQVLQSLWAGYGQICRITATPDSHSSSTSTSRTSSSTSTPQEVQSYILKLITPPPITRVDDEGHIRKILSYQAEQYFYTHLAPQMPPSIPVAQVLSSIREPGPNNTLKMAMILTDLKQTFPVAGEKRAVLAPAQVDAALDWLSSFHAFWWPRMHTLNHTTLILPPLEETKLQSRLPKSVWLNGGYTYLATRTQEYATLLNDHSSEWNLPLTDWEEDTFSISHLAAALLSPPKEPSTRTPTTPYMTLIHGDVKSENLFTKPTPSTSSDIAFYDFQYTGLGLGVCDLAKLFTCSIPLSLFVPNNHPLPHKLPMQDGEKALLRRYWTRLRTESGREYAWDVFVRHWETTLVDWLRFQASWGFWGNTAWLEARARWILADEGWREGVLGMGRMAGVKEGFGGW